MNIREKMEFLATIRTARDFEKLNKKTSGFELDLKRGTCHQIVNLRYEIQKKMNEEHLSRNEVAKCIGIRINTFNDYFARRRNLPYKYVERILALLWKEGTIMKVSGYNSPSH